MKINLKNKVVLEVEADNRLYFLDCASDSPLGEIYDVLSVMRSYVIDRMVTEQEQTQRKEKEETPADVVSL